MCYILWATAFNIAHIAVLWLSNLALSHLNYTHNYVIKFEACGYHNLNDMCYQIQYFTIA